MIFVILLKCFFNDLNGFLLPTSQEIKRKIIMTKIDIY